MGALIGKGGESINEIRRNSQSDIQVDEMAPGIARVSIRGNCDQAQKLIFEKLKEKLPHLFPTFPLPTPAIGVLPAGSPAAPQLALPSSAGQGAPPLGGLPGVPQPGMPQPGMPQPGMPQPGMLQLGMRQPGMLGAMPQQGAVPQQLRPATPGAGAQPGMPGLGAPMGMPGAEPFREGMDFQDGMPGTGPQPGMPGDSYDPHDPQAGLYAPEQPPEDPAAMGQEFDPRFGAPPGLAGARGLMPGMLRPFAGGGPGGAAPGLALRQFPPGVAPFASTITRPQAPGTSATPTAPRGVISLNGLLSRPMGPQAPTDASL